MTSALALVLLSALAVTPSFQTGQRSLDEGDFVAALESFDLALRQTKDLSERAKIHVARGQAFAALGRYRDVEKSFEDALVADPTVRLDPTRVHPTTVATLDSVRDRLRGDLVVSGPSGGKLLLDGQPLGTIPFRGSVPVGLHRLEWVDGAGNRSSQDALIYPRKFHSLGFSAVSAAPKTDVPSRSDSAPSGQPWGRAGALLEGRVIRDLDAGLAFAVGGGFRLHPFVLTANLVKGASYGMDIRAGVLFPKLIGPLGVHATLDGATFFEDQTTLGFGASVGVGLHLGAGIEPFVEGSFRNFPASDSSAARTYVLGTLGLRWRFADGG